jgi:integral membrane protein (TIGR01906 family)
MTSRYEFPLLWLRRWRSPLIVLLLPVCLALGWITVVIGPSYPRYAYAQPWLPPDAEWSGEQRLALALVAVAYLESWQPATAVGRLADQQQPGTERPLYQARELAHLQDVKRLTDGIRLLAIVAGGVVGGCWLSLWRQSATRRQSWRAVGQGGWLTVGLLTGVGGLLLLAWPFFFYQFHGLLFAPGSWSFAAEDSLMRLYPEPFFYAVGLLMSGGSWLGGWLALLVGYGLASRQPVVRPPVFRTPTPEAVTDVR